MYRLFYSSRAVSDISRLKKSGQIILLKKLERMLNELMEHPLTGIGHPEQLKGRDNTYSRELDRKNRLVYVIKDLEVHIDILQVLGHYDDK